MPVLERSIDEPLGEGNAKSRGWCRPWTALLVTSDEPLGEGNAKSRGGAVRGPPFL
jgi:hypothetical protein